MKIQTNSSDSIFPNKPTSMILQIKKMASIQKKINSRPRQKLKFETPKAEFFKQ